MIIGTALNNHFLVTKIEMFISASFFFDAMKPMLAQPTGKDVVPIVIKTHKAKERMMRHAFDEVNKLAVVKKGAVMIRIQD